MQYRPDNPLIVQSDSSVLLEVANPRYEAARDALTRFAELVKSPEHMHTYRITPLSLWNAAAGGLSGPAIVAILADLSKFTLPDNVRHDVLDYAGRYGRIRLVRAGAELRLVSDEAHLLQEVAHHKAVQPLVTAGPDGSLAVDPTRRGHLKQAMVRAGWPVEDLAGYTDGAPLKLNLRSLTLGDRPFRLRPYQEAAVAAFYQDGAASGGSGVVVLPCGAGKTVVAMGAMATLQTQTLILSTNITAVRQWISELLDKTDLTAGDVGEYSGEIKQIRPVTVTTYQILTHRSDRAADFVHFSLFNERDWGLIIYDEVHLLPAPVFRITAEIQARRRLGLTATLVREDGREEDVFSLVGPKRYDVPWRTLETQGFIATALCREIRVPLPAEQRLAYATADDRKRYRIAAENPVKDGLVLELVRRHGGDQVLVIGQYLDQLQRLAKALNAPLITGQVPNREREELYNRFKQGELGVLVVSKVANFAVDLPDANVAIQVSGSFGSRQEEAQRLGRILRPKCDGGKAFFYSLVTGETKDQAFALKRQRFLTEQGYQYEVLSADATGTVADRGRVEE